MAYGRLDVFWPDGQFMTFHLVENNISVGRSTGNTIVLDTSTISRYHLTITHDGEQVMVTDLESVNGTFVDGTRLTSNQPRPLYGGEEIQIGHLRLIYHQIDEMPTQPMAAVEDTTQRIELRLPDFRLDLIAPEIAVSPGAHTSAELSITNTSTQKRRYRVKVSGMPDEWVRLDRHEIEIPPDEAAQVLINFRPARRSDSRPGDYPVTVRVAQADDDQAYLDAQFTVRILAYSGFGMALATRQVRDGEPFRLHLHNQGSSVLPLSLSGSDPSEKLRFQIESPYVSLAPGQRLTVQGAIRPARRALVGRPRTHRFDLLVRSNDAARFLAVARGQYIERPMLPRWAPFLIVILGAAGLALLALAAAALTPRPEPRILTFSASSLQVAQGEMLNLSWEAVDVTDLMLLVNRTPAVAGLGPLTRGLALDTSSLLGDVTLELVGRDGDREVTAITAIKVYRPLGDGFFTTTPERLVRNVVQSLAVSWNIPGAVSTRLSGLEAFSTEPIVTTFGESASLIATGIAAQPFTLRLMAEDEAGNVREQTLDIQVINPECRPSADAVTLLAGPDVRQQVVGTVPAGAAVVVNAQDATGLWLRAQLPGGLAGWGARSSFDCGQTFNPQDLIKELNVPTLPPPTLTPTALPGPDASPPRLPAGTPTLEPTASG